MKIIGIDPGYERLGIAVIEKTNHKSPHFAKASRGAQKTNLVFSETFKTSTKDEHPERLFQIQTEIERIIKKYKPERLGIETLFFNKNVKTAIKVAEARGIILALAQKNNLKIFELSPQQIKIAVTGYGKSDKNAISKMVSLLIEIPTSTNYSVANPTFAKGSGVARSAFAKGYSVPKKNSTMLDDEYDAIATALAVMSQK
jgi:crossover junction endodeoxyribonuclease RuvC